MDKGKGLTYEAMLTVPSIAIAQDYYELLMRVKNGEDELKISEDVKKALPDFPKFAITYSVTENEEGVLAFQLPEMNPEENAKAQILMAALRQGLSDLSDASNARGTICRVHHRLGNDGAGRPGSDQQNRLLSPT